MNNGLLKWITSIATHTFNHRESDGFVLPSASAPLSNAEYALSTKICDWTAHLIEIREQYIEDNQLDRAINNPAANWDTDLGYFAGYYAISTKDRERLRMLRLFTQVFSGYYMGLKSNDEEPIAHIVPPQFDKKIRGYLKKIKSKGNVWWIQRREDLINTYPCLSNKSLPLVFGESGFQQDNVILNHDLFVYLERLALLKSAGIIDEINNDRHSVILEIGSGFGALSYLMRQFVPNSTYICLDLPESLCFAALYLARFFTNIHLADEHTDWSNLTKYDFVFVPNYMFHRLVSSGQHIDLGINTLSMSEMDEAQVRNYCTGVAEMIGDTGVFFEQNQDNRHLGLCFAKEIAKEVFGNGSQIELPNMDLTQGTATLWRCSNANEKSQY